MWKLVDDDVKLENKVGIGQGRTWCMIAISIGSILKNKKMLFDFKIVFKIENIEPNRIWIASIWEQSGHAWEQFLEPWIMVLLEMEKRKRQAFWNHCDLDNAIPLVHLSFVGP